MLEISKEEFTAFLDEQMAYRDTVIFCSIAVGFLITFAICVMIYLIYSLNSKNRVTSRHEEAHDLVRGVFRPAERSLCVIRSKERLEISCQGERYTAYVPKEILKETLGHRLANGYCCRDSSKEKLGFEELRKVKAAGPAFDSCFIMSWFWKLLPGICAANLVIMLMFPDTPKLEWIGVIAGYITAEVVCSRLNALFLECVVCLAVNSIIVKCKKNGSVCDLFDPDGCALRFPKWYHSLWTAYYEKGLRQKYSFDERINIITEYISKNGGMVNL